MPFSKISAPRLSPLSLALLVAVYLVLVSNRHFWAQLLALLDLSSSSGRWMAASALLALIGLFSLLLLLFSHRVIFKPALGLILLLAAAIGYFQTAFGVIIDKSMIQNIVDTDYREAAELVTPAFLGQLLLLGLLPALLIWLTPVRYRPLKQELAMRGSYALLVLSTLALLFWMGYKDFSLLGRQHRELRLALNPTYPIYAAYKFTASKLTSGKHDLKTIAGDARQRQGTAQRRLVVLVLGETARAANFSLNGYQRDTNPRLRQKGVLSFEQVMACGTSTAESVPCMFSHLSRSEYSIEKAAGYTNILDVLAASGVGVLWRDNNSGCKGTCKRVALEDLSKKKDSPHCRDDGCFDEVLLEDLEQRIAAEPGDMLLVLHQKGSHGPAYYRRYPASFRRYLPECTNHSAQECSREELRNAYDNSILYTDHFLAELIDLLQARSGLDSTLIYLSDHGESLGENSLYLHGLPYFIAPDEQKRVPMILWFSATNAWSHGAGKQCLRAKRQAPLSHDNLFHSLLGLFEVQTSIYQPQLDLFQDCRDEAATEDSQPERAPADAAPPIGRD